MNDKTSDRFWSKVDIGSPEECWNWNAYRHKGYGKYWNGNNEVRAHRYSFFLHYGFYPPIVMHICNNPPCVNPGHLLDGTQALNVQYCVAQGRHVSANKQKTHCPQGHEYTEINTYVYKSGHRKCRTCNKDHYLKRKRKMYLQRKKSQIVENND